MKLASGLDASGIQVTWIVAIISLSGSNEQKKKHINNQKPV